MTISLVLVCIVVAMLRTKIEELNGMNLEIVLIKIVLPAFLPAIPALILLFYLRSALELNSLFLLVCAASLGMLAYLFTYLVLNNRSMEVELVRTSLQKTLRLFRDRLAPGGTGS